MKKIYALIILAIILFAPLSWAAATGLTITSTPDGETYNWAQITTGFDANAVTKVSVWRAL